MPKISCLRHHGSSSWCAAALVAAALSCSLSVGPATAQQSANHVVSNCQLDATTLAALAGHVNTAVPGEVAPTIDFIVVYSLANPNDGQDLGTGAFTGPVLCRNPGVNVAGETGTDPIPGTVSLLDIETALITQYQATGAPVQKRFCHSVNENSDCFKISGGSGSPD
jgi:hypothetical protein